MNWHPLAEKFPLMEGDEWEAFKADIGKTKGPEQKVTYRLVGGKKEGLDGRNRFRACAELGIECPMEKVDVADEDVAAFIIRRNVLRRHMSRAVRRELVSKLRSDGKSTREIAGMIGVSHETVRQDTQVSGVKNLTPETQKTQGKEAEYEKALDAPASGKVTGRDGKKYSATAEANGHVDEPEEESKPATDAVGHEIPEKAIPAFEAASEIAKTCRQLDGIVKQVQELGKGPGGRMMHLDSQVQSLRAVRKSLWGARATHVCPYCKGKKSDCGACKSEGWVNASVFDAAPNEKKQAMIATPF